MAAEDLQSFFAETNEILEIQPLTLQLKPEHYISPLVVMLPQNMKYPFNDIYTSGTMTPLSSITRLKQHHTQDDP